MQIGLFAPVVSPAGTPQCLYAPASWRVWKPLR